MKRIHPNVSYAAAIAALALCASLGGCKTPSGGIANPFLAPDRVPPPATRALLPGQAQPYYPGDPLPVMQSGTAPSPGGTTVATAEAQQMPSADTNLAWASPSRGAAPASAPPVAAAPNIAAAGPRAIAQSAEPAVAIPADGDALRFELPAPIEPEPFTPIAAVPIPAPQQLVQVAAAPATGIVVPVTSGVVPASYSEPLIITTPPAPSPWREPEIALTNTPPPIPAPPIAPPPIVVQPANQPVASAPVYWPTTPAPNMVANNIDVQLRAVPSPSPESIVPTMPRIRLPGYLPPPPSASDNDGFRPRSSMR